MPNEHGGGQFEIFQRGTIEKSKFNILLSILRQQIFFVLCRKAGVKFWPGRCQEQYEKLATYIANLPDNRWLKRAMAWTTG